MSATFSPDLEAVETKILSARLDHCIEREFGLGSRSANLAPMQDGHAGLTFGFDVVDATGRRTGSYVLKLAPDRVTRRGNTDVYRQAPLLRGLKAAGMPVPAIAWASPDEDDLGAPYLVMARLPGRIFLVWDPDRSFSRDTQELRQMWLQAARMLARLHTIDWQTALPNWERPRPLIQELEIWTPLLRHAQNPEWLAKGNELHGVLVGAVVDERPIGVVHGDFQPGNILYVGARAQAVIDWELSSIGSQGLDIGWLLMMSDPEAWEQTWRPIAPVSREDIIDAYREAGGPTLFDIDWYQALAHFRLGAIAGLNVKLHRTGRRPDPFWERFAPSIATLFASGIELARRKHIIAGGTCD